MSELEIFGVGIAGGFFSAAILSLISLWQLRNLYEEKFEMLQIQIVALQAAIGVDDD